MSHTIRGKDKLLKRVRRVRGQIEAVERALDAQSPCSDVLQCTSSPTSVILGPERPGTA